MVINVIGSHEDIETVIRRFPSCEIDEKFSERDYNILIPNEQVDDFTDLVESLFLEWQFA